MSDKSKRKATNGTRSFIVRLMPNFGQNKRNTTKGTKDNTQPKDKAGNVYFIQTVKVPTEMFSEELFRTLLKDYYKKHGLTGSDVVDHIIGNGKSDETGCNVYKVPVFASFTADEGQYDSQWKTGKGETLHYAAIRLPAAIQIAMRLKPMLIGVDNIITSLLKQSDKASSSAAAQPNGEAKLPQRLIEDLHKARKTEKQALYGFVEKLCADQGPDCSDTKAAETQVEALKQQLEEAQRKNESLNNEKERNDEKVKELETERSNISQQLEDKKKEKENLEAAKKALYMQVQNLQKAQKTYDDIFDLWDDEKLQKRAAALVKMLDACREFRTKADGMAGCCDSNCKENESQEEKDAFNYYLLRIAKKFRSAYNATAAAEMDEWYSELRQLATDKLVRKAGRLYKKLNNVKADQREDTLMQLLKEPVSTLLSASVIAADEYALWLPEFVGVPKDVSKHFTPIAERIVKEAKAAGFAVDHIRPFTPMSQGCKCDYFFENKKHRWPADTVIEVIRLAVNGDRTADVKATRHA